MVMIAERTERTVMTVRIAGRADAELDQLASDQVRNESYRRLACAIVDLATREARYRLVGKDREQQKKRLLLARDARAWLGGSEAAFYLECLGIERPAVIAWLDALPELERGEL